MRCNQAFKRRRVPAIIILCAARMYPRYPLSHRDTADLKAERGGTFDRSTVYRWVLKVGPELAWRTAPHHR